MGFTEGLFLFRFESCEAILYSHSHMSTETEHVHLQIDSARKYHVQSGLAEFVEMAIYGAAQRERETN